METQYKIVFTKVFLMQIQVVVDMVAGDKRGRVCQTLHTLLRSIIILTWEACSQPSSLLTSGAFSRVATEALNDSFVTLLCSSNAVAF